MDHSDRRSAVKDLDTMTMPTATTRLELPLYYMPPWYLPMHTPLLKWKKTRMGTSKLVGAAVHETQIGMLSIHCGQ